MINVQHGQLTECYRTDKRDQNIIIIVCTFKHVCKLIKIKIIYIQINIMIYVDVLLIQFLTWFYFTNNYTRKKQFKDTL